MKRYSLALIGKSIQRSLSPALYRRLLDTRLAAYQLLDLIELNDISKMKNLIKQYDGVSVTAPYKNALFKMCDRCTDIANQCEAINCLHMVDDQLLGDLTDAVAARDILTILLVQYPTLPIAILGDGSMSRLMELLIQETDRSYEIFSRKRGWKGVFSQKKLIINTCLREAIFPGTVCSGSVVWDLNYDYSSSLCGEGVIYQDGKEMLEKQAIAALQFWDIKL